MVAVGDTDDGALERLLASCDAELLIQATRDWDTYSLSVVASETHPDQMHPGAGQTNLAPGSVLHTISQPDVTISAEARDTARQAMKLREQGSQMARDALRGLGVESPENVFAYALPAGTLGFVNSSTGIAVATDMVLPFDVITALSGTCGARWTMPEPPPGWTPLQANTSGTGVRPERMSARITHWCLYGKDPGVTAFVPGVTTFPRPETDDRMGPEEWPCDDTVRRRMDEVGQHALLDIARRLAATAGCQGEMDQALEHPGTVAWEVPPPAARFEVENRAAAAEEAVTTRDWPADGSAEDLLRSAARSGRTGGGRWGPCKQAAAEAKIGRLATACGAHGYAELIVALLARIAERELLSVATELVATYPGAREPGKDGNRFWVLRRQDEIVEVLTKLVRSAAEVWLRDAIQPTVRGNTVTAAIAAMAAIYKESGPVLVDFRLPVPGHLKYPDDDPVGLAEIAERLNVQRGTVDQWRQRNVLPEPDWPSVGGRPAWKWSTIVRWWAPRAARLSNDLG